MEFFAVKRLNFKFASKDLLNKLKKLLFLHVIEFMNSWLPTQMVLSQNYFFAITISSDIKYGKYLDQGNWLWAHISSPCLQKIHWLQDNLEYCLQTKRSERTEVCTRGMQFVGISNLTEIDVIQNSHQRPLNKFSISKRCGFWIGPNLKFG